MSARVRHEPDGHTVYEGTYKCPHCGHENSHWFNLWTHPEIVCCDVDTGGCDTYVALTAVVDITVTATARKIEGIERREPAAVDLDEGVPL